MNTTLPTDMNYNNPTRTANNIVTDLSILAGRKVGDSDVSWQDVAGTLAVNLFTFARLLDAEREGQRKFDGGATPVDCVGMIVEIIENQDTES